MRAPQGKSGFAMVLRREPGGLESVLIVAGLARALVLALRKLPVMHIGMAIGTVRKGQSRHLPPVFVTAGAVDLCV